MRPEMCVQGRSAMATDDSKAAHRRSSKFVFLALAIRMYVDRRRTAAAELVIRTSQAGPVLAPCMGG